MAMRMGLLGKKLGMTQVFTSDGERVPVTAITAGPCVVVGKRSTERDGYTAIQLGFEEKRPALLNKPEAGRFAKSNVKPFHVVQEIRLPEADVAKYEVGQTLSAADIFTAGQVVDVVGTSKGKGFQGVMKRHNLGGHRASHGTHEFFRHGGSIGCRLTPGRVHKGKRMTGHMGDVQKTIQNLELVEVIAADNVVLVRGSVPGGRNGYLLVQNGVKKSLYKRRKWDVVEEKSKNPMKASKAGGSAKPKK